MQRQRQGRLATLYLLLDMLSAQIFHMHVCKYLCVHWMSAFVTIKITWLECFLISILDMFTHMCLMLSCFRLSHAQLHSNMSQANYMLCMDGVRTVKRSSCFHQNEKRLCCNLKLFQIVVAPLHKL